MGYEYHDAGALRHLGERIRDKAITVSLKQWMFGYDHYAGSQVRANNYPSQHANDAGGGPLTQYGYTAPTEGRQDAPENLKRFVAAENAFIPDLFASFAMPNPDSAQAAVDSLFRTAAVLAPDLRVELNKDKVYYPTVTGQGTSAAESVKNTLNFIDSHMAHWDGDGADAFMSYLDKFEEASKYQHDLARSLAITLAAQIEIRRRTLTDVWEVGQKTLKALSALEGNCPDKNQMAILLTVLGAIGAVAIAIPTGGTGLVIAAASLGGTVLAVQASDQPADRTIGGQTVPDVIHSMQAVLNDVSTFADQQHAEIATCLQKLSASVEALRPHIELQPPAGTLALKGAGTNVLQGGRQFYNR